MTGTTTNVRPIKFSASCRVAAFVPSSPFPEAASCFPSSRATLLVDKSSIDSATRSLPFACLVPVSAHLPCSETRNAPGGEITLAKKSKVSVSPPFRSRRRSRPRAAANISPQKNFHRDCASVAQVIFASFDTFLFSILVASTFASSSERSSICATSANRLPRWTGRLELRSNSMVLYSMRDQ